MSDTQPTTPGGLAEEIGKRNPFTCLRQEAYLNLIRTNEQLVGEVARLLKEHGLSDPQYNVLRILRGAGKPLQVYQIVERMITPQTDISRLVDRLATAGLVHRERSHEDRRVVWVSLTPASEALLRTLDQPIQDLHASQFTNLSDAELQSLSQLLLRARNNAARVTK